MVETAVSSTGGLSFEDLVAQAASAEATQPAPKAMPIGIRPSSR